MLSNVKCKFCNKEVSYTLQDMIDHLHEHESSMWNLITENYKFE